MVDRRGFEQQLVEQLREHSARAMASHLRGAYPDTEIIVTKPERPHRGIRYPVWDGDFSQPPGFEHVSDSAVLIYANVIEYEHR